MATRFDSNEEVQSKASGIAPRKLNKTKINKILKDLRNAASDNKNDSSLASKSATSKTVSKDAKSLLDESPEESAKKFTKGIDDQLKGYKNGVIKIELKDYAKYYPNDASKDSHSPHHPNPNLHFIDKSNKDMAWS